MTTDLHSPQPAPGFLPTALDALEVKSTLAFTGTARYLVRAGMAGIIIGILMLAQFAVVASVTAAAGPGGAGLAKMAGAAVFGLALILIYYARAELTTSTMMLAGVGVYSRRIGSRRALSLIGLCLAGNALGGLVVALMVRWSSVLSGPAQEVAAHIVETKLGYLSQGAGGLLDLFVRAVICNLLINLAVLVVYKGTLHDDGAKMLVLWSGIFLFVVLGSEHSVANSVLFLIHGLSHGIDVVAAVAAVLVAVAGNLVGGALLVGVPYAYLNDNRRSRASSR